MVQASKAAKRWCVLILIYVFNNNDHTTGASGSIGYQVFFMKEVWLKTIIGEDMTADTMFHFHQVTLYSKTCCIPTIAE